MHEGHRDRLTKRFMNGGLEGFEDHELLEFLLFYALPRVDTNSIAHRLIERFGSLSGVLEANPKDLMQVDGIGQKAAAYLAMFPEAFRAYERSKLGRRPSIRSIREACAFAKTLLFGKPVEQIYVIWLNTQNRIIHSERLSEGSVSESPVHLSRIAAAALRHHAVRGIIAHNHPGGSVRPSPADIRATQDILRALAVLGIELVDHIIISDNDSFSFQADSMLDRQSLSKRDAYAAEYACVRQFGVVLAEAADNEP
jgi:DNA repair protein RadC